jgi:beta-xylosidase
MPESDRFEAEISYRELPGLEPQEGLTRRDPSDVIRHEGCFYVWYTKTDRTRSGYDATVWCARSQDGLAWEEIGEALPRGEAGEWDEQSVFTPGILVFEERFYLFYTTVEKPFSDAVPTAIGAAAADSPEGPWEKLPQNPLLLPGESDEQFDSHRVDDSCLIVRDGLCWLYYKGRQQDRSPAETKMGLAVAERPEGPWEKHPDNPLIPTGHEVLCWPDGEGVAALVSRPPSVYYAPDGLAFEQMTDLDSRPIAPGAYRPDAFEDPNDGASFRWGISHKAGPDGWPYLVRFDVNWPGREDDER